MVKAIVLTPEQHKCLREHLNAIELIIGGAGENRKLASERKLPVSEPKETKTQRISKYSQMLDSGQRGTKPIHLRKNIN